MLEHACQKISKTIFYVAALLDNDFGTSVCTFTQKQSFIRQLIS